MLFAQVIGKAATDPLERRNRRRTEGDDDERFRLTYRAADHGVPRKHRKCQTKLTCIPPPCTRRSRLTLILQTSDVASHDSGTCRYHVETQCVGMRSELKFCATAHPISQWSFGSSSGESDAAVGETESSVPKPFLGKDCASLDKAPHTKPLRRAASQWREGRRNKRSEGYSGYSLRRVMSSFHLSRTECVRIEV